MSEQLKLSVLTTIYNGREYLENMFESVLNQTYTDFEWIIVDDGSEDGTWEELQKYRDSRIRLYKLSVNRGVGYANRYALSLAKGEYIAKVDVDDISALERFEKQINYLNNHSEIDMIDSFIEYFSHNEEVGNSSRFYHYKNEFEKFINRPLNSSEIAEELYWDCIIINGAIMARRDKVLSIGYSEEMTQGEDYLLFYEMNKAGMKFYKLPEILVKVRVSNTSTTARNQKNIPNILFEVKKREMKTFLQNKSRPLAIWGAGQHGRNTMDFLKKNFNIVPDIFFDAHVNKHGEMLSGVSIKTPDKSILKQYRICVASSYGRNEIISSLKSQGCIHLVDYYVVF